MQRIHQQNQEDTWNRSQIRSEKRNYVGYANDHTDQKDVWHAKKVHANIAQHADDGGIQYFSNEKANKGLIGKAHGTDDKIRVLRRKYCICEHFRLGDKAFLVCHQIKGNDGSDQEVLQEIDQVKNTGRNILQHLLHLRKNILCQVILGI